MIRPSVFLISFAFVALSFWGYAQDTVRMLRYGPDFRFSDGVYITFEEWKNNKPRIRDFDVIRTNTMGARDDVKLTYTCTDNTGQTGRCTVENCFAYVRNGTLYLAQGYYGYYYRTFIVGSLTHFIAFSGFDYRQTHHYIDPNSLLGSENDYREFLLDFETGNTYDFSFRTFSAFLKERDTELYEQLMASKRKRSMIHHYLLKYNERHPISFPAD